MAQYIALFAGAADDAAALRKAAEKKKWRVVKEYTDVVHLLKEANSQKWQRLLIAGDHSLPAGAKSQLMDQRHGQKIVETIAQLQGTSPAPAAVSAEPGKKRSAPRKKKAGAKTSRAAPRKKRR